MADLISVLDCPCDGCQAKPCGHPARCVKFTLWLNKTVQAVELPCKIGDYVWAIRNYKGHIHPQRGIVSEMCFVKGMKLHVAVKNVARGEWGKTIFGTYEEAERAIEELSECAKEICKVLRGKGNMEHLAEEIADATICLEQLRYFFGINQQVCDVMDEKIMRLDHNIRDEQWGVKHE